MIKTSLLGCFCLLAWSIQAQVYVGFKGGGLYSRQLPSQSTLHLAIPVEWNSKKDWLSYRFELGYLEKGLEVDVINQSGALELEQQWIQYADAQLLGRFKLPLKEVEFFGLFGPYLSRGFKARVYRVDETSGVALGEFEQRKLDEINLHPFDFGATLGAGIAKEIAQRVVVMVDLRYRLGILDVNRLPEVNTYHEAYSFSMGLFLPIN